MYAAKRMAWSSLTYAARGRAGIAICQDPAKLLVVYLVQRYTLNLSFLSIYRPKDGKEDLGPHAYTIRNSSYSFHARVYGDLSVSIPLAFPYEMWFSIGG